MCGRSRWRGGRGEGWGPSPNAAIPDPGFPGGMMPALGICADDLAGVDLGELQRQAGQLLALHQRRALPPFLPAGGEHVLECVAECRPGLCLSHAELEALMDSVQRQADDDRTGGASRRRIQCLQHSVSDLLKKAFADKVVQQADKTKTLGANCPLRRLHQVHAPEMRAALL